MRVADKRSGINRRDLLGVGDTFGVRDPAGVIDRIQDVVDQWPTYAKEHAVPPDTVGHVADELQARAREVAA